MQLISFDQAISVKFQKSAGSRIIDFAPGEAWAVSNHQRDMVGTLAAGKGLRCSHLEPRVRAFSASPLGGEGRSLLFYAGAAGFGDQLMAMPVAKLLAQSGYKVTVMVEPGNEALWWHQPFIEAVVPVPISWADFQGFDEHALCEFVTNADSHPDQRHPTDALLWRLGINPALVPAAAKVCPPTLLPAEVEAAERFLGGVPTALYQLTASNLANNLRSLSVARSWKLLRALAAQHPRVRWLAGYDQHNADAYKRPDGPLPANIIPTEFPALRHVVAVASQVAIGVGPDSFYAHLCGVLGRPFVSYFGHLPPVLRTKYYPRQVATWEPSLCPLAPCYHCYTGAPLGCPGATEGRCTVVDNDGTVDRVLAAVKATLG